MARYQRLVISAAWKSLTSGSATYLASTRSPSARQNAMVPGSRRRAALTVALIVVTTLPRAYRGSSPSWA